MSVRPFRFAIVRRFRRDMATAAGLPEQTSPLADTLAQLDAMHAEVLAMLAQVKPRDRASRTRLDDMPLGVVGVPMPVAPEPLS